MRFTNALLTAILATAAAAQEGSYICNTSDGSPYLHHVNQLIDNLKAAAVGEIMCNSHNGCGGTFTDYTGPDGGAVLQICGFRCGNNAPGGLPCLGQGCGHLAVRAAGAAVEQIRDQCVGRDSNGDERVGGIQVIDYLLEDGSIGYSTEIRLFSAPA
ncbi:hypothetical protein BJY04DRAFT_96424 [Aspergillus karnatakaensis]|uniref:uncharacterized protein n=1 Tax=Aspergillus karnatakaensis TaxID=1810916 RepID=UPI003CCDE38A